MSRQRSPARVGIVGAGRIAVDTHIRAIREAGGMVVALADVVPGRAARFAAQFNIPHAYESAAALLASGVADALDICTPPVFHAKTARSALEAGVPVYLEKPPVMNHGEMRSLCEVSRQTGVPLVTGTNQIHYPAVKYVHGMLDRGELGEVYLLECRKTVRRFYRYGWHRRRAIAGGGVVMDSTTHRLDLALFLLSNPTAETVSARTYDHFAGRKAPPGHQQDYLLMDVAEGVEESEGNGDTAVDVEDTVVAHFRLANGNVLSIVEMVGVHMPDETVLRLYGTQAGVILRMAGAGAGTVTVHGQSPDGTLHDIQPVLPNQRQQESTHTGAFRHFFHVLHGEIDPEPGLERAENVMALVDAIYRSAAKNGRETEI